MINNNLQFMLETQVEFTFKKIGAAALILIYTTKLTFSAVLELS